MSKFFEDFKKFALKGNVMDMAIGVVIGGAFSKIVSSLVNDIIMPFFSLFTSTTQFTSLKLVMRPEVLDETGAVIRAEAAITYGAFIQNVVDFLLIALSIFLCIRLAGKIRDRFLKKKEEPEPEPAKPAAPTQEELLTEIRDLLRAAAESDSGVHTD